MTPVLANIFQPLIDIFDQVIVFFHDTVGLSWGFSIIALTVAVRTLLMPLTFKQFKSMARLQELAPQMKELQEKYKDDKQRQQQEMMKFYKENQVNPSRFLSPAGPSAARLRLAVLHAAQGPEGRHLRAGRADRQDGRIAGHGPRAHVLQRRSSPARRSSASSRT